MLDPVLRVACNHRVKIRIELDEDGTFNLVFATDQVEYYRPLTSGKQWGDEEAVLFYQLIALPAYDYLFQPTAHVESTSVLTALTTCKAELIDYALNGPCFVWSRENNASGVRLDGPIGNVFITYLLQPALKELEIG